MAKPKRPEPKLPCMKLIKSCASKCKGLHFIYIGVACYPDGKTAFSITVQEKNGSFGGAVYAVVDTGSSLPLEVLYTLHCHNTDLTNAFLSDDTLILKYDSSILDDLIQSSNRGFLATGDKTVLEGIVDYLQRRGERPSLEITHQDFVIKQYDLPAFAQHQFSHMDSTGVTCYEDIVKLTPLISSQAINYQYGFTVSTTHRHAIVFTDGKSLIWVPDEDPLDTEEMTIFDKRLLQTVKGRAFTIIDLLRDPDHGDLVLIGMLATGEVFAVKHPQEKYYNAPEAEAIKKVYPPSETAILSIPLCVFMDYVGRISSLKSKDRVGVAIKFAEGGKGSATWFCKRFIETTKETKEDIFRLDTFCEQDLTVAKALDAQLEPYDTYYDKKLDQSLAISMVPALPLKTFIGAKLCDMTDYYFKVCIFNNIMMWVISPDRCNFGNEVATCVMMPVHNGYSVLSNEDKAVLQIK